MSDHVEACRTAARALGERGIVVLAERVELAAIEIERLTCALNDSHDMRRLLYDALKYVLSGRIQPAPYMFVSDRVSDVLNKTSEIDTR